jgi:flagellar motor switch protein FliM
MSDQILSQEEIDALLSSMNKGDDDFDSNDPGGADLSVVRPYNLTSQGIMLREQFSALEEIHDRFIFYLENSLSSTLQKPVEVKLESSEIVKFGEFLSAFSNPTSLNIFTMEPLIGSALHVIETNLVFSLIECMFGGEGKTDNKVRDFSNIEKRMMIKFTSDVLKNLEKAWNLIYQCKFTYKLSETKPEFIHIAPPSDSMIINVFSISWNGISGNMHICIPYLMLEPIKDKLSASYKVNKHLENAWRSQMTKLLKKTKLTLVGELGSNYYTVRDLLNMSVNDVLMLRSGPHDPILLKVEGVPIYDGFPGVVKGNRAVQISSLLRTNTGDN